VPDPEELALVDVTTTPWRNNASTQARKAEAIYRCGDGWPDGVTTGPLRREHADAAIELANAIAAADNSGERVALDDFTDTLNAPASTRPSSPSLCGSTDGWSATA